MARLEFSIHDYKSVRFCRCVLNSALLGMVRARWRPELATGDSQRFTVLQDPMTGIGAGWQPFMDLIVSSILPFGRSPADGAAGKFGADVFGEGRWGAGTGVQISAFLTSRSVVDILGQYHWRPSPDSVENDRHEFDVRLSVLRIPSLRWSWGGVLYREVLDGRNAKGNSVSGSTRIRLMAHVSRVITMPFWELSASVVVDPPWSQFSRNLPYAVVTGSLTLKRSFF